MDKKLQENLKELEEFHESALLTPELTKKKHPQKLAKLTEDDIYLRQLAMRGGYRKGWNDCLEYAIQNAIDQGFAPKRYCDTEILSFVSDQINKINKRLALGGMPWERESTLRIRKDMLQEIIDFAQGSKLPSKRSPQGVPLS